MWWCGEKNIFWLIEEREGGRREEKRRKRRKRRKEQKEGREGRKRRNGKKEMEEGKRDEEGRINGNKNERKYTNYRTSYAYSIISR